MGHAYSPTLLARTCTIESHLAKDVLIPVIDNIFFEGGHSADAYLVRCEGSYAQSECERDGGRPGVVAKVAGVGGPRGAAYKRGAHDGHRELRRMARRDQYLHQRRLQPHHCHFLFIYDYHTPFQTTRIRCVAAAFFDSLSTFSTAGFPPPAKR